MLRLDVDSYFQYVVGFSSFLNICTTTNLALVLSFFNVAKFRSDQLMGSLMHPVVQKTFGYWSQAKLVQNALFNSFWEFVASVCDGLPGVTLLSWKTDELRPFRLSYSQSQVMAEGCKPSPTALFTKWYRRGMDVWGTRNCWNIVQSSFIPLLSFWGCQSCDADIRPLGASVTLLKFFPLSLVTKQPAQ